MLRQQQLKPYREIRKFEDMLLYQKEDELIPLEKALVWALVLHLIIFLTVSFLPLIMSLFGININFLTKIQPKHRDIEFVIVSQPEEKPINKNTPFRAATDTRAGGIHDPNRPIKPPEPALPKSAPSQQNHQKKQKVAEQPAPKKAVQQPVQKPVVQQIAKKAAEAIAPKQVSKKPPAPPKPTAKPYMPVAKAPGAMKLPVSPMPNGTRLATAPSGPVTTRPTGKYGSGNGNSTGMPKPIMASGGYGHASGTGNRALSGSGAGKGSAYSPGGGNVGNPGPGNPNGRPGVDAIKEPNFGPYMSELQRRIKANWDPPRGDESKRVVLLFTIARDGRLLNVKVIKSSGVAAADKAALAAVELTAPFRSLPSDFRGQSVDIQFTFDYNVWGARTQF